MAGFDMICVSARGRVVPAGTDHYMEKGMAAPVCLSGHMLSGDYAIYEISSSDGGSGWSEVV